MKTAEELINEVIELEKYLLKSEVRSSKSKMEKLLSDEFIEFGASGKIYRKEDIITDTFKFQEANYNIRDIKSIPLGMDVVQLTYILEENISGEKSLRSSIWQWSFDGWKIIFHQGTKISN